MPDDTSRYKCQLALPGFDEAVQAKLQQAKVLIVGAGGLGCPAAQYLTAAGIGTICIADFDTVSNSNLHRQVLFTPEEIGLKKVFVACAKLQLQNPGVKLVPCDVKITSANVTEILMPYDVVVDCTDNFETRYLLNDACVLGHKPLVYGAIYQYEGHVCVWNVLNNDGTFSPNYRDLFPGVNAAQIPNCAQGGVMPTLAGIIGCIQANEVLKYFTGQGDLLSGKILMLDVQTMQSRTIKLGHSTGTTITAIDQTPDTPLISVRDLKRSIDKDVYRLIDVRTSEEHQVFNIGGVNVPLSELDSQGDFILEKPVVMYCASGNRSEEAVKLMSKRFPGLTVFSLEGGLNAWRGQEMT